MRLKKLILGLSMIIVTFMLLSIFESTHGTLAGNQDKTVDYEKTIQDCQESPKVYTLKVILPFLTWNRSFGGSAVDKAYSLIQTTDGGYAVAGFTRSYGAGGADFWLIKLDRQGNKVWDKTFGGSAADEAYSLIQTTDGGYAVAGRTVSYGAGGADFWLIKLDRQGNKVWDKAFGGSKYECAYSLIQTTDGGYAVAGITYSYGAGGADFWLIKLDRQGNKVWDKTFGGSKYDEAYSLIQTTDGGYAVAGYTRSYGAGDGDFWVIKLDSRGNKVWDKTFGESRYDKALSLIQTTDGGYAVAGVTRSYGADKEDFWVIKLDSRGNKVWDKTFGGSKYDKAYSLIQTTDGGYAVAGITYSYPGASDDDFWVIKLDSKGNEVWDKTFGGSKNDKVNSLIQTTDDS
jgi:predicted secreted protein